MIALRWLTVLLAVCFVSSCKKSEDAAAGFKEHRAILYFSDLDDFEMDYEGTGYRQSSTQNGEDVTFKAMHLDHWPQMDVHDARLVDASFTGTVVVSGEDRRKLSINLKVKNQVSFRIRLMGVQANGEKSPDDIIEKVFAPGEGDFHVDGQMVNFYGKRKME